MKTVAMMECAVCGDQFHKHPATAPFPSLHRFCTDCVHLRLGYSELKGWVSEARWYAPWTWGRGHLETFWTAEEARERVRQRREAR